MLKGFLVIDDISLEEAKRLMARLKKKGRWLTESGMAKDSSAAAFAILTHGYPKINPDETYEFG